MEKHEEQAEIIAVTDSIPARIASREKALRIVNVLIIEKERSDFTESGHGRFRNGMIKS